VKQIETAVGEDDLFVLESPNVALVADLIAGEQPGFNPFDSFHDAVC